MNTFKLFWRRSYVREIAVLSVDVITVMMSFLFVAFLCRLGDDPLPLRHLFWHFAVLGCCLFVFLLIFKVYRSIWYYAESRDYLFLMAANGCGFASYLLLRYVLKLAQIPTTVTLLAITIPMLLMLAFRFAYRRVYQWKKKNRPSADRSPLLIVGAGDAAVMLLDEMLRNSASLYQPVCLIDDDPGKIGGNIRNIPIEGPIDKLPELVNKYRAREILVAIPSAGRERNRDILDMSMSLGCRVRVLPDMLEIVRCNSPEQILRSVRDVQIDDLLGRDPVRFDNEDMYRFLSGKTVMVTGGGGSIGSELCRQIAKHNPRKLIIVDIYENNAYDIQQELRYEHPDLDLNIEIASVRDRHKINLLFERYLPQIVFHAAAHKHVPLMEDCPEEAVRNNVFGTYNVATAADRYHADRFILVSTDKAVNPTNVMGATKRLCEMIVQSMAGVGHTRYAAVRFGNVLGSNGSVIPLFKRQIAHGGPVTVTDKRIIRYFMTIPEAAQLVLQAGSMAQDSEIFVLDMGQPVSILELAEHLIRLSGYTPYVDMPIKETGLRPGEKLYEELLMRSENLEATTNHKIFIERQREPLTTAMVRDKLDLLEEALQSDSPQKLVETIRRVVPTFKTPEEVNAAKMEDLNYENVVAGEETVVELNDNTTESPTPESVTI